MKFNYTCETLGVSALKHAFTQFRPNRLFALGALLSSGLIMSCSNDTESLGAAQELALEPQNFSLVPAPLEPNEIKGFSAVSADTKLAEDDCGRFDISLRYLVNMSPRQIEVFEAAAARWERIIIQDVPSITGSLPSAFVGFPAIEGTIDDIVIEVVVAAIDGPGQVLGQAGPRYIRNVDGLPVSGVMFFDEADMDYLDELDLFEDVIVHEMGHVLGVGTLWNYGGRSLLQGTLANPFFAGHMANVHWGAEGGTEALPIENQGGGGTALSHWRESALRNELMTGYINLGENQLSRITAGSLGDLGYGIAVVGEEYYLPKGAEGEVTVSSITGPQEEGLHIGAREIILEPVGFVHTANE